MAALAFGCTASATTEPTGQSRVVEFAVYDGNDELRVDANAFDGENAFDAMSRALSVEYQSTAMGPFITSINGKEAGTTHYWALYVGGEYAQRGIGQYTISEETRLFEWHLEEIQSYTGN